MKFKFLNNSTAKIIPLSNLLKYHPLNTANSNNVAHPLGPRVDEAHEVRVLGQEVKRVELVLEEIVAVETHAEDAGGDKSDDDLQK